MRTRKLLALLLAFGMSITMGVTALADEADNGKNPGVNVTASVNTENPGIPTGTAENPSDSTVQSKPTIKVTNLPTAPLIRGQGYGYTVEVDPNGVEGPNGWVIVVKDSLSPTGKDSETEVLRITGPTRVLSATSVVSNERWKGSDHSIEAILYRKDDDGNREEMARSEIYPISVRDMNVKGDVEFPTENIVTGKEYPFSVTLTNQEDVECRNVSVDIAANAPGSQLYNFKPTYNITEYPEGATVELQENNGIGNVYLYIRNFNIPADTTVKIAGTVCFPEERTSVDVRFGFFGNNFYTDKFSIKSADGGDEADDQKPGVETEKIVLKDKNTGITVSGVEKGVELVVKSLSKEQQTAIEEKVEKIDGETKGIKVFDISLLKDGKEIQPVTPVIVTIPLPEGFSTNVKLYHQNEQGVLEPIDISVKDSTISFEAKSFSPYVLVDLGVKNGNSSNTEVTDPTGTKAADASGSKSPKTGDASSIMVYLVLALAAMGCTGFVMKRKLNR